MKYAIHGNVMCNKERNQRYKYIFYLDSNSFYNKIGHCFLFSRIWNEKTFPFKNTLIIFQFKTGIAPKTYPLEFRKTVRLLFTHRFGWGEEEDSFLP